MDSQQQICCGGTRKRLGALVLLLANAVAHSNEHFNFGDPIAVRLAAYSRAVKLHPLGSDGAEIRVWVSSGILSSIQGFVISKTRTIECDVIAETSGSFATVKAAAPCKLHSGEEASRHAFDLLGELSQLDGQSLRCAALDGLQVFVEGTDSGKAFAFSAGNPLRCSDPSAQVVSNLLTILRS